MWSKIVAFVAESTRLATSVNWKLRRVLRTLTPTAANTMIMVMVITMETLSGPLMLVIKTRTPRGLASINIFMIADITSTSINFLLCSRR